MQKLIAIVMAAVLMLTVNISASACTMVYVGGDMTDDGACIYGRVEDYYDNDFNKIYYVAPAGNHAEGELYEGCYGFTWTFTHDSFGYTARRDDNLSGVCPDCEGTHDHTPYEEAGTNDHGVTVSATETLHPNDAVLEADPFMPEGIEEAEIATIILSEAATAREGVELLLGIYDDVGAYGASGLMIADQNEQWYIENLTGHEYIAVLLPPSVAFLQPNLSVLGMLDLDDTENVIASENVIAKAKEAGTFVGDEGNNAIDYRASYHFRDFDPTSYRQHRMANGLNFLMDTDEWTVEEALRDNASIMTNIAEDGSITVLHNDLALANISMDDIFALYRVYPIGYEVNEEIHLYRFYPEAEQALGTVEWSTMDDLRYNVYIPCYPMLLTDTWEGFKISVGEIEVLDEQPESGDYYETDGHYYVYPEGWESSYFWTMNALSNKMSYSEVSAEDQVLVTKNLARLQEAFEQEFETISADIAREESFEVRQSLMTDAAIEMSKEVHDLALALYRYLTYGESSDLIQA